MFESWSVAVKVSLINGVGTGLLSMARQFAATHGEAKKLKAELHGIQTMMLVGGGMTIAGLGILAALKPALNEAARFQTQMTKFSTFGLGDKMTAEAAKYAKGLDVIGSSYTENMRRMGEAQGVFRESGLPGLEALKGAMLATPVLGKIHFVNAALHPGEAEARDTSALSMMRFIEMRGGIRNAQTFNAIADAGFKAIQSSGGNVNWEQYRQFMARGGVAAQGLNNETLFGKFEPIIGELKGSTAGFALRTAYNRLNGIIKIPNQVAHDLVKYGVWNEKNIEWNKAGGIKRFNGNPLIDASTYYSDPISYYKKHLLPAYAGLDQNERARRNAMIFGSTGGAMFSLVDRQMPAIERSVAAQRNAFGVDQSVKAAQGTFIGKQLALHARFTNLLEQTGEAILPLAIHAMETLIPMLKAAGDFANKHPAAFGAIIKSIAGLGLALAAAGAVTTLVGGAKAVGLIFKILGSPALGAAGSFLEAGAFRLLPVLAPLFEGVGGLFAAIAGGALIPFLPLIAGIAGVGLAVYELWRHWDKVGPLLKTCWNGIVTGVEALVNSLRALIPGLGPVSFDGAKFHRPRSGNMLQDMMADQLDHAKDIARANKDRQHTWHFGTKGAQSHHEVHDFLTRMRPQSYDYTPSNRPTPVQKVGDVYLDQHKVGVIMQRQQNSALGRPPVGGSAFDPTVHLTPVGAGSFSI